MDSKQIVLTGIRPTSNLTIANYVGAIKPIVSFQEDGAVPYVFVADLHALTDNEPEILKFGDEILIDLLASGVDPKKTIIYKQSSIANEIGFLTLLLARHVSVAELLRLPTLKEKVKSEKVENANALLMMYPVMMAADILIQRANIIPVGKDQESHIEITRRIAKSFNKEVFDLFPEPKTHVMEMVKILSLKELSKMSKSSPDSAIFMTDTEEIVEKKIKKAQTANSGYMSEHLTSHITLIKSICDEAETINEIDSVIGRHMNGLNVMGDFKKMFTKIVINFLSGFQSRRAEILNNRNEYFIELSKSSDVAVSHARETIKLISEKLSF